MNARLGPQGHHFFMPLGEGAPLLEDPLLENLEADDLEMIESDPQADEDG